MSIPLDIAGQVTLLAWTLDGFSDAREPVQPILGRCLELAQIRELQALKIRKLSGQSVFGQVAAYPSASAKDVATLRQDLAAAVAALPPVEVPTGKPVPTGDGWSMPTAAAADLAIASVRYNPPL